jgi:hypothetical protein
MGDREIHEEITRLVSEEHQLRTHPDATADQQSRMRELEVALDRCWDLLRQRNALKDAGEDPDKAHARSTVEVEGYLQ